MMVVRQAAAIVILPFTVSVLVPLWIARTYGVTRPDPATSMDFIRLLTGIALVGVGLALFGSSLRRFIVDGKGTLAPWDPPRRFVVTGPYQYVRNPMISGVIFVLLGEAVALWSLPHLTWAVVFLGANAMFIPLVEEPQLRARFGEPYQVYRQNVGRLLPRLTPWRARSGDGPNPG